MMKDDFVWLSDILALLKAQTNDFRELAKLSGEDPETLYVGTSMNGADLRGQDLRGMHFTNLTLSKVKIDSQTKLDILDRQNPDIADGIQGESVVIILLFGDITTTEAWIREVRTSLVRIIYMDGRKRFPVNMSGRRAIVVGKNAPVLSNFVSHVPNSFNILLNVDQDPKILKNSVPANTIIFNTTRLKGSRARVERNLDAMSFASLCAHSWPKIKAYLEKEKVLSCYSGRGSLLPYGGDAYLEIFYRSHLDQLETSSGYLFQETSWEKRNRSRKLAEIICPSLTIVPFAFLPKFHQVVFGLYKIAPKNNTRRSKGDLATDLLEKWSGLPNSKRALDRSVDLDDSAPYRWKKKPVLDVDYSNSSRLHHIRRVHVTGEIAPEDVVYYLSRRVPVLWITPQDLLGPPGGGIWLIIAMQLQRFWHKRSTHPRGLTLYFNIIMQWCLQNLGYSRYPEAHLDILSSIQFVDQYKVIIRGIKYSNSLFVFSGQLKTNSDHENMPSYSFELSLGQIGPQLFIGLGDS